MVMNDPAEIYYSNGGELNLNTNKVSPKGGLTKRFADEMKMQPNLLPEMSLSQAGNSGCYLQIQVVINLHPIMFVTGWNVSAAGNNPMRLWKQGTVILLLLL